MAPAPLNDRLRVLSVTNMWPVPTAPQFGIFVEREVCYLRRHGVAVDVLFINGRASRAAYLRAVTQLRAKLQGGSYNLIHAHYVFTGLVCRTQRRLPIVLTHHGVEVMQGWQSPLCWVASRAVDAVVVRTDAMRTSLGLAQASVIPAGVDLDFFRPMPKMQARDVLSLPRGLKMAIFVGEPRPEKRLALAQQAVALLPDVSLHHVHGVGPECVRMFMNAADVLVLTSRREGSPNVVKEALACNLPVVAVDVGDVAGLIGSVDGCHLVEPSPLDVARGIRRVLDEEGPFNGREAVATLAWPNMTRRLIEVYEKVMAAHA
jgi:teichuronic acid biosynthesis glycosyltransferase TuaC